MLPLIIQSIIPLVPVLLKLKDAKQDEKPTIEKLKESTLQTEIAQVGYIGVLASILQSVDACNDVLSIASLSCVTGEQWSLLAGVVAMAFARLRDKKKA